MTEAYMGAHATPETEPTDAVETPAVDPEALLVVEGMRKHFPIKRGILVQRQVGAVRAVDGVSFSVR
ncbi:MAG: hypothetical protein FWD74_03510, partial [Actinomycetia bacterium]|nr:hypothetical protein [Actinomycetes bacterium]